MEEDIKILEEMKKDIVYDSDEDYDNQVAIRQIQAIENLIKGYRELEVFEQQVINHQNSNVFKCKNYIPKSKIKEELKKIDQKEKQELKGMKGQDRYFVKQMYQYMKKPLQELLEEE